MKLGNVAFSTFVVLYAYTVDPLIDLFKWLYKLSWDYPRQANGILFFAAGSAVFWFLHDVYAFSRRDGSLLFLLAVFLCLRGLELLVVSRQTLSRTRREAKEA